jgi:hypothetical protein
MKNKLFTAKAVYQKFGKETRAKKGSSQHQRFVDAGWGKKEPPGLWRSRGSYKEGGKENF